MTSARVSLCLLVIGPALLPGCSLSHERDPRGDAGTDGAAPAPDGARPACAGTPSDDCFRGCTDVSEPEICVAGAWICPPGTSTSLPPGCCGLAGWCVDAGPLDAGAEASPDDLFPCGWSETPCARWTQYCDISDVAVCVDFPAACGREPSCGCLDPGHESCDDDGHGGITTHTGFGG